jgi:LPPG:FO 2-phospho-L-lactate transferase
MRVLVLSGGVGGAKLALGLMHAVEPSELTIVANTGDDFEHLGLHVSPDVDTLVYTLAGVANQATGWGRADETWSFLASLSELGEEDWFRLGDKDLAVHVARTHRLARGERLSEVVDRFSKKLGVRASIVPMSDDPVRTIVETKRGALPFQHYFVKERCAPEVTGFRYRGIESASPSAAFVRSAADPRLDAVVIAPSNPYVSVDPILNLPGVTAMLRGQRAPIVAVSPIVGGRAVKGPLGKMLAELGRPTDAAAIADHYRRRGLLDGFVFDRTDEALRPAFERLEIAACATDTLMTSLGDRVRLAKEVLAFSGSLRARAEARAEANR